MTKTKKILILLILSITLIIVFLFYSFEKTTTKNGFNRLISKKIINLQNKINLENYYSFASVGPNFIILSKYKAPNDLLKVSIDLKQQQAYTIPLKLEKEKLAGMNKVSILKDSIYILTGLNSTVSSLDTNRKNVNYNILDTKQFFQSDVISPGSYLIRSKISIDGIDRRKVKKVNRNGKELASYVPEKQVDGYFCTDGTFIFDQDSKNIIYLYYYRGGFTCLDTNLKIKYKANTIDTVRFATINLKKIKNEITHALPPSIVNKRFAIANGKIYINSALKADNDVNGIGLQHVETIDVYDIKNGAYINSFYMPKIDEQKLVEFRIYKNKLYALYKKALAIFKLPDEV